MDVRPSSCLSVPLVVRFPAMQSTFSFTYVEILAVPTTNFINNPGHLRTGGPVFVGKKRLNTIRALENNPKVKAAVEFVDEPSVVW